MCYLESFALGCVTFEGFALGCVTVRFCVILKLCYTKDCVTFWKTVLPWKTALHLKIAFSGETVLLWKTALLENCVTFEKFCVGVRYFWRLLIDDYLRYLVKKKCCLIIILKLRYLKTDLLITCFWKTVLQWKTELL